MKVVIQSVTRAFVKQGDKLVWENNKNLTFFSAVYQNNCTFEY